MYCKDVEECLEEVKAYCNGEKTGHTLLVNTENYGVYQEIFARLLADKKTKKFIMASKYCPADGLPNLDDICSLITGDGCYVLAGISQAAMLRSAAALYDRVGRLLEMPIRGHAVVLLEHAALPIKEFMSKNLKVERKVVLVDGTVSVLPRIYLARSQKECIGAEPLPDMKHLFLELENLTDTKVVREITVVSPFSIRLFSDSAYSVHAYGDIYEKLTKVYADLASGTEKEFGTEEQWKNLAAKLEKAGSLSAVAKNEFGASADFALHLGKIAQAGDSFRFWLLWLFMKVFDISGNRYLSYVLKNSRLAEDFEKHLYMDLLEINVSDSDFERYYMERKSLINDLSENLPLTDVYCSMTGKHGRNAMNYLTDSSDKEKREFLRCLSMYDYSEDEIMNITASHFPSLYLYMQPFEFTAVNTKLSDKDAALMAELTEYFKNYKLQKLTNRIWPEFLKLVEAYAKTRPYNRLQARSGIVAKLQKKKAGLFFFDALGAEYLSFITAKCEQYDLAVEISVGYSFLPTITAKNKEFIQYFQKDVFKIDDLDELKHHSQVIDYQKCKEPIHLFMELEIIDRHLRQIQSRLVQGEFDTAVVVADHGASRLAVIHEEENSSELSLDEKAGHSGRCCLVAEDPDIPFVAYEDGFAVLANYSRFKGGRKANVEVHGGATLEEVLVPVIVLSRKPEDVQICFEDSEIRLHGKGTAAITVFSNIPLHHPRMLVNGRFYEGFFVGGQKHARFEMPELKRSRDYTADIYDGDKPLKLGLPFRVQKQMGKEVLKL